MDLPEAIDDHQNVQGVEEEVEAEDVANNQVIRDRYHEHVAALNAIADAEENFLNTIGHLNSENRKLEQKINDADAQNNLLQQQLRVLMKKMENLESFMVTLNSMKEEQDDEESCSMKLLNCPRCGYKLRKDLSLRRSESLERESLFGGCLRPNDNERNPLMIDLVVAKVMSHLPQPTLLKCRQVNHLWKAEASYQLQRKNTFNLNFDNIESITKFMANPESSNCLLTRLKVDLGFVVNLFRSFLEDFFKVYGPGMTYLNISCEEEFANRIYTEEFRNIFLGYLEDIEEIEITLPTKITERQSIYEDVRPRSRFVFPHLRSLVFHQFDNSGGYSVWFTKEMIKMAPNLRSLRIETHTKEVITRVLLAIGDRECRNICSQLKHLYLDAYVTEQHLEMLTQFEFQLETLQITCLTVEVSKEMVEALLNRHRNSLRTLILGDYQKRPTQTTLPLTIKLPNMPKLHSLKFVDPCFPDQRNLILNPLSYAVQLPNLRKIEFLHEIGKPGGLHVFTDIFNGSPTTCETLRELRVCHGLTDPSLIAQAAKMFPSLVRLDVANVPDPVVIQIWEHFEHILELRLELCPVNVNVDSLITGIPNEVCKKIQERNLYTQVEAMDVLDIIRTEFSVCNLTNLRSLTIDGLPSTLVTAVTVYLALSQMKNLTFVSIKSDVATLSRECRRVLGERLKLMLFELF